MASHPNIIDNPFTDPLYRTRPSTDSYSREGTSTTDPRHRRERPTDDGNPYAITTNHKPCNCCKPTHVPKTNYELTATASFCRATHTGQIATDLNAAEKLVGRDGYNRGYKAGYDDGRKANRNEAAGEVAGGGEVITEYDLEEAVQLGVEEGWRQANDHYWEVKRRAHETFREEMKHLEGRDLDEEDREWAEYLASLNEPAKLTVWARKAKAAVKAKMGKKGKGKAVVEEGKAVEAAETNEQRKAVEQGETKAVSEGKRKAVSGEKSKK